MKKPQKILVIEDEIAIREGLLDVLVFHGFDVEGVEDGGEGLRKALTGHFDLILLDVMLPTMNGFDICNEIREKDRDQSIIMLTAKNSDEDIIQGLTLGADDYVAKPFSVVQLILRIKAVLRRSALDGNQLKTIKLLNAVVVDTDNLSGIKDCDSKGQVSLKFTRREIDILECLAATNQRPVSREELLHKVWGYAKDLDLDTRTVDIHMAKLRRKIETNPKRPENLVTVRGAGYRLMMDVQEAND